MALPRPRYHWIFHRSNGNSLSDVISGETIEIDRPSFQQGKDGKAGTCLRFNPDPKKGARSARASLTELASPTWTAAMWVKREGDTASSTLLSSPTCALKLEQYGGSHKLGVTSLTRGDWSFEAESPLDAWAHLVFVGTESNTTLFINGEYKDSLGASIKLPLQWIGSTWSEGDFGAFCLGELKIFAEALTAEQVLTLHKQTQEDDTLLDATVEHVVEAYPALPADLEDRIARVVDQKLHLLLPEIVGKVAARLTLAVKEPVDEGDMRAVLSFGGGGAPARPAMLVFAHLHNVGVAPGEGDEYVEIANRGDAPADLSGYQLHASAADQRFVFPEGTALAGGESVRVYTNMVDPETGGFSFGSPKALWDNQGGDAALLLDRAGSRVAEYRVRRRGQGG